MLSTSAASLEAKLRAAISRAYYAAFIKARNHLSDRSGLLIPTTSDAHSYVSQQFELSVDPVRRTIGERLVRLRIHRRQADYVDTFSGIWHYTNSFKNIRGSYFNFEQLVN